MIRRLDEALAHATGRKPFGRAIADFQLVQAMTADMRTDIQGARVLDAFVKRPR